jgi:hypothetical protein
VLGNYSANAIGLCFVAWLSFSALIDQHVTYLWGVWIIAGVWIGYWIYWPLVYTIRNYTLQITDTHRLVPQAITVFTSRFLTTASTSGDSLASRTLVPFSQPPVQNCCQLTISQLCRRLAAISHQPPILLFTNWLSTQNSCNWTLSFTNRPLHVTSFNCTADNWLPFGWCFLYKMSGRTQQETPSPTILLLLSWWLPCDRLDIVSARTCIPSRCLETDVCLSANCIAMAVLVTAILFNGNVFA